MWRNSVIEQLKHMALSMILLPLVLASCFAVTPRFLGPPIKAPPEIPPEPSPEPPRFLGPPIKAPPEIPPEPSPGVCGDNEQYVCSSTACQITCANRNFQDTAGTCKPFTGCVCNQGLVRLNEDATGPCVTEDQCPPSCPKGEHYVTDTNLCEKTCDNRDIYNVMGACVPCSKCVCNDGLLRLSSDPNAPCVNEDQCPCSHQPDPKCDKNEEWTPDKKPCPPDTCDTLYFNYPCAPPPEDRPPQPGCKCIEGFLRDSNNNCIRKEKCPPLTPTTPECGKNEIYSDKKITCPPQSCEAASGLVQYLCANEEPSPGCNCIDGFLRDANGTCIPKDKCPPGPVLHIVCGKNEVESDNKITCPPQTCEAIGRVYKCLVTKPERGCNCIKGYLRNAKGVCIPKEQCPGQGKCRVSNACKRTCANPVVSPDCVALPPPKTNIDGCECQSGYILENETGKCILENSCTTQSCPANEYYNKCKVECPLYHYCPVTDIQVQGILTCEPTEPCVPGCSCLPGYMRKSYEDPTCIIAATCPPVNCTRPNEEWNRYPPACLAERCEDATKEPGLCLNASPNYIPRCTCKQGTFRNDSNICVPVNECPGYGQCDANSTYVKCPSPCPPTCANPNGPAVCAAMCRAYGCQCKPGYVSHEGKCIKVSDCPPELGQCDANSTYVECPSPCPPTCAKPTGPAVCAAMCLAYGCQCKPGYVSHEGKCIELTDCPRTQTCPGPNEVWNPTPSPCPLDRCEYVLYPPPCYPDPNPQPRCECKQGYYRNESNICVPVMECGIKCPSANETMSNCGVECPTAYCPTTDSRAMIACSITFPCKPGCICQDGYKRKSLEDRTCIKASDCPPVVCTRPNEEWNPNPPGCILDRCEDALNPQPCDWPYPHDPQCMCKKGFYRNATDICVPLKECPIKCPANETITPCKSGCPTDYCPVNDNRAMVACSPPFPCRPGCVCAAGYKKKSRDDPGCIKYSDCPPVVCTRPNEVFNPTPPNCIADRCTDYLNPEPCNKPYPNYMPQCVCQKGYYRNSSDLCVPASQCGNCSGLNEIWNPSPSPCPVDRCEFVLNPPPCAPNPNPKPRCECKEDYYRNELNKCVPVMECGIKCPGNQTFVWCNAGCPTDYCPTSDSRAMFACDPPFDCPHGCACSSGYLRLSETDNKCIKSSECPPVKCTRPNEYWNPTPPDCIRDRCEDAIDPRPCDFDYPKPPQCMCQSGYYRNASDICVPVAECPKPECPVNEIWDTCPSDCLAENCADINNQPSVCNTFAPTVCRARCVCQKDHFRDSNGNCVPANQCPTPPEACASDCTPTCAVPNPPNCQNPSNVGKPCCEAGQILDVKGGKCIPIEKCPTNQSCNGDPHARIMACPWNCPSTCCSPQASSGDVPCKNAGCACESGYIFSKNDGKCIPVDSCPGGDPCGPNGTFVDCSFRCPYQYCPQDDSGVIYACKPGRPCPPGCGCKINYLRLSYDDDRCILASECPPVECTRPNEVWNSCTTECLAEQCEDAFKPPAACNTLLLNCIPKCVCQKGTFRNSSGICVPAKKCPKPECPVNEIWDTCPSDCLAENCADINNQPSVCNTFAPTVCRARCVCQKDHFRDSNGNCVPANQCPTPPEACASDCTPTCAVPNPPNCPNPSNVRKPCCEAGQILDVKGGKCIPIEKCPTTQSCNGDPHARIMACPWNCPSTCCSPQASSGDGPCKNAGCACESGYIFSKNDGKCIPVDSCPGGDPCGPNGTFVDCSFRCPHQYCPQDDSGVIYACKPGRPCPPGCGCKINYLRLSYEDDRCILASECPPVECTRPNEVWNSCTTECLAEQCEDAFKPPAACNTLLLNCIPKCVCQKGTFRNSSGICVPAKKCPKPECPKNEIWDTCPSDCLAENCADVNNQPSVCNTFAPTVCRARCVCQKDHFRDSNGNCVPANQCPTPPEACTSDCTPTCAVPNPPNCPNPSKVRKPCCEAGHILDVKGGKCIPIEKCPKNGCNGDPNAVLRKCPVPCVRSTCAQPEAQLCPTPCKPSCECAPGYILEKPGGKCIKKEKCPGGAPKCGVNATFVNCKNSCPTDYCPIDDNRAKVICETSPFAPCVSGCRCKINYRIKSRKENKCILSSQCPPVKCTRPNEVWNPCPSDCQSEYCEAAFQTPVKCNTLLLNCNPRCVCKKNFFRNSNDICIPKGQCPKPSKPCGGTQ